MIVIATDRMYIVSKKIHSIHMDEDIEMNSWRSKKSSLVSYTIKITFELEESNSQGLIATASRSYDPMTVEFKVYGYKRAVKAYRSIVSQIREQCPDQIYLDKIAENLLSGEMDNDPSTEEVCISRKTKRRSQEILRRTQTSFRRSRKRGGC